VAAVLVAIAGAVSAQPDEKEKSSSRTAAAEQLAEINRLLAQFRMASGDPEKREEIVQQVIKTGPPAVTALFSTIRRELLPQLKHYSGKFNKIAIPLARKHSSEASPAEVKQLRETVLGLQKLPNFSHDLIVAKGDPALQRLHELFVIDRQEVLKQAASLQEERKRLLVLGRPWEECAVYLHNQSPGEGGTSQEAPSFEKYMQGEEDLAAGLAVPMDAATRSILSCNARLAAQLDPEEARAISALNLTRNLLGLNAVAIDLKLCATARHHSQDMQRLHFFAHESPVAGKKLPWDRAKRFGTTAASENIFMGRSDGVFANMAWFESPGHHKNMLAQHVRVGVGRANVHFTEMFGN
jgi:uncharacterized protein YkwD